MKNDRRKGFSLVELLVVIAIIGLLSTIAVVALSSARQRSRDVKRVADVRQVVTSLELYNNDYNGYPEALTPVALGSGEYTALCESGFHDACTGGELVIQGLIPSAPTPSDGDCSDDDNAYTYETPAGGVYQITFCLGAGVGDLVAGTHVASPSGIN